MQHVLLQAFSVQQLQQAPPATQWQPQLDMREREIHYVQPASLRDISNVCHADDIGQGCTASLYITPSSHTKPQELPQNTALVCIKCHQPLPWAVTAFAGFQVAKLSQPAGRFHEQRQRCPQHSRPLPMQVESRPSRLGHLAHKMFSPLWNCHQIPLMLHKSPPCSMMRSYHPENSRTHQNTELKPDWACLVLTWVTRGESQVTHCPFVSIISNGDISTHSLNSRICGAQIIARA